MKILITGINSALGNNVARKLANEGHKVVGLGLNTNKSFNTYRHDLSSNKKLILPKVDACMHFAFITDAKYCEEQKNKAYKVNVLGTKKILDYCKEKKISRFIFISSGAVYGFRNKVLKEETRPKPMGAYSSMKYEAELLSKKYSKYFDVVVLRYFFPYGPKTKKNALINNLITNIMQGKKITLNKSGKPIINPVYITDLVNSTCLFCSKKFNGFNIFNIAGQDQASIKDISSMIGSLIGKNPNFTHSNQPFGNMIASINKLNKHYRPKIGLRQGLKSTISFLKNHEAKQ